MNDLAKFLDFKNQLQTFYNYKAKEERELLYASKIQNLENQQQNEARASSLNISEPTKSIGTDLVALTTLKNHIYLEIISIFQMKEISFKYSSDITLLFKVILKSTSEISIKFGEKDIELKFEKEINCKEFLWCLIKLISKKKLDLQVQVKNVGHKDLEEIAEKNKFHLFNKIFEEEKKKQRYEVTVSQNELEDLEYTLKFLNIDSIINFDLENLNSKIEQFNITTKESFLKKLQGDFSKDVSYFLTEINTLDDKISTMNSNTDSDLSEISKIWNGIQKIENANHRIELRNENKRKLYDYMKKLTESLTISEGKKKVLVSGSYLSNSEISTVDEVLKIFVKFYKSRKKQDIKIQLIKECHEEIKNIIEQMIENFNIKINQYIKTNYFKETFLLKDLPSFTNQKLVSLVSDILLNSKKNRNSLESFFVDRRFFIERLNTLVSNQDELNKTQIFKDCLISLSKGMRDLLVSEFNIGIQILQKFFECEIIDSSNLNINLDSDDLLKYDALEKLETDYVFEINKYLCTFILNSFFSSDKCVSILMDYFSEGPNFLLEKNTKIYEEVEKVVTAKIYEYLNLNFETCVETNILLGLVIFTILSSLQEKVSKNVYEDMIDLSVKDVFETSYKIEESYMQTYEDRPYNNYEDLGIRKISLQETKNFVMKNMKTLHTVLNDFFNKQKEIIVKYECEVRRVGIIPMLKKALNFIKLFKCLTKGIKQDFIVSTLKDFKLKMKTMVERIAKVDPKYTNIIMIENYYYAATVFRALEVNNIFNTDNSKLHGELMDGYNKFVEDYVIEACQYIFKDFFNFYNKFLSQYNTLGDQVRMQSAFTFANFDKTSLGFFKELARKIDKVADRCNKHFCKELSLAPSIWVEIANYLNRILISLDEIYAKCYGKTVDQKILSTAKDAVSNFNFKTVFKPNH